MNCFNCGAQIPDGQNFCGRCGAPQNADPGIEAIDPSPGGDAIKGSKNWLWALLGCGGLLVVSCCLGLVLLFTVSNAISGIAVELLDQVQTSEPELLSETFAGVATLLPESTPWPTGTPVPSPSPTSQFNCGGIGVTVDRWLQVKIVCEQRPAQTEDEFMRVPAHTRLQLSGYPVAPAFHEAQINVYPVEAYRDLSPEAATQIDQLQDLLQSMPERAEQPFPFLPVWNAAQMITTQYDYLQFVNGQGIRFLAQYGQAAWPINNEDLFYTFQGLTTDGAYYISAVLPVTHPGLPPDGDAYIGEDFDAFIETYAEYLDDVEQQLEDSASKSFHPRLTAIDALVESMSVR